MLRFHHERWAGDGYPLGIAGEQIPLSARVLCIADVYDVLTSDRPYREGFAPERAFEIMEQEMSGHFDPVLLALFKHLHTTFYPAGTADDTSVRERCAV